MERHASAREKNLSGSPAKKNGCHCQKKLTGSKQRKMNKRDGKRNALLHNLRRLLSFMRRWNNEVSMVSAAFRGRFQSWLQMDRSCKGENCSTCAKCVRCRRGLCFGGRWEKDFGGCSKCIHCTKCVASGNDEDWEAFQSHARIVEDIPRAPEIEGIEELPAPELAEDVPRNQCHWCGLALQRSTSVHRKFCMNMPIRMWLARQRATSRNDKEFGEGRPCGHCGSIYSKAHARARHEKQCGDRFTALGMEKKSRNFHSNDLG